MDHKLQMIKEGSEMQLGEGKGGETPDQSTQNPSLSILDDDKSKEKKSSSGESKGHNKRPSLASQLGSKVAGLRIITGEEEEMETFEN